MFKKNQVYQWKGSLRKFTIVKGGSNRLTGMLRIINDQSNEIVISVSVDFMARQLYLGFIIRIK